MNPNTRTLFATVATLMTLAAGSVQADPSRHGGAALPQDNGTRLTEGTSTDSRVEDAVPTADDQRLALTRRYLLEQGYRSRQQQREDNRSYDSAVGQGGGNRGQARGHALDQQQGGVSVGSLVSESGRDGSDGARGGGVSWQYAPQSNTLMLGGDNYAPIQLSNVNAHGGNVHIGDVNKGNLYNSQIGNNQQGSQGGDSANAQSNSQNQQADSRTGSQDAVRN
jgi:hypothetical protein